MSEIDRRTFIRAAAGAAAATGLVGLSPSPSGAAEPASDRSDTGLRTGVVGAVYVNTNKTINAVAGFARSNDGTLTALGETATGGSGSGPAHPPALDAAEEGLDPLISANALTLSRSNRFVFAVNTTSNSLTTLQVRPDFSLRATDVVFTGGQYPNSIGTYRNLVFVTNIGDPALGVRGSLAGFALTGSGRLRPIPAATAELEGRPSNVQITPDGRTLIVSELDTGNLVSFPLARDGTLGSRNTIAPDIVGEGRNIPNPIGFQIVRTQSGTFVVSTEAREVDPVIGPPPTPDTIEAGSVSSYRVSSDSSLTRISNDVRAGEQVTTCWITFARDRRHFWVANALAGSLSTYTFDKATGEIALQAEIGASRDDSTEPSLDHGGWIDVTISPDGRHLYQLLGVAGAVRTYTIENSNGALDFTQETTGLPQTGLQGIVAI